MTPQAMLQALERWCDAGWLRRLDLALARFIHEQDADAPAGLLLAAALVAQLEGRGHSALPLADLPAGLPALLGWPPEGGAALGQALAESFGAAGAAGAGPGTPPPAWLARTVLELDPVDEAGASPLVLCGGLLYLRRYWRHESQVAAQIRARAGGCVQPAGAADAAVDPAQARQVLDRLFGPGGPQVDWQKVACAVALRSRLSLITGGPGTGKTYTAARLLVLLQALNGAAQPLRVALAAPTGKAAARLRQSIQKALQALRSQVGETLGIGGWVDGLAPARTLHALLGTQPGTRRFRHDAANPLEVDLLIVDEASMVHLEMMAQLLQALPAGARLVLMGDKDQLASVEAGAVLGDLCQAAAAASASASGSGSGNDGHGYGPETRAWIRDVAGYALPPPTLAADAALAQQTVVLRQSHRFGGPIGQLALAVNAGRGESALGLLKACAGGSIALHQVAGADAVLPLVLEGRAGAPGCYRDYLDRLARRPEAAQSAAFDDWAKGVLRSFDGFRVLTAVREGPWGVAGLNAAIERALEQAGWLPRSGPWYEGRPVIVTRNDPSLGVFNGDVGVVLKGPAGHEGLRCYFLEGDDLRSVSVNRLAAVETAFAMTVHKSQGSEFGHVVLVLPDEDRPVLTRELVYTGITRAIEAFTLVCQNPGPLIRASDRLTRRVSGLGARLAGAADDGLRR